MRIWSLHPAYLDTMGLLAAWRECLLAKQVLRGLTRGYRNHPQLERFKACADPVAAADRYLAGLHAEAAARGYAFDAAKFDPAAPDPGPLPVARGQVRYELALLRSKLARRAPERLAALPPPEAEPGAARLHPLFAAVDGPVAAWERALPEILAEL